MGKTTKIVYMAIITKVIIDDNATNDEVIAMAKSGLEDKIGNKISYDLNETNYTLEFEDEKEFDIVKISNIIPFE